MGKGSALMSPGIPLHTLCTYIDVDDIPPV